MSVLCVCVTRRSGTACLIAQGSAAVRRLCTDGSDGTNRSIFKTGALCGLLPAVPGMPAWNQGCRGLVSEGPCSREAVPVCTPLSRTLSQSVSYCYIYRASAQRSWLILVRVYD